MKNLKKLYEEMSARKDFQIIKALQKLYGAYLPIFIDNAESVNDFNLPDMDCQLIKLKVSDDKDLRIEVE